MVIELTKAAVTASALDETQKVFRHELAKFCAQIFLEVGWNFTWSAM